MSTAIQVIGIVIVAIGVVFVLKPGVMKRLFEFFKKGSRLYIAAPVRLALAIVFLVGADQCRQSWVIIVIGILFLISGILVLLLGPKRLVPILEWFQGQSEFLQRVVALIVLAVGVIIIISA